MARHFTLSDAELLLPEIYRLLHQAIHHKAEFSKADRELEQALAKIRTSGGARVDRGAILAVRARRDSNASALKQALDEIENTGALIKDLDIGLIDFLCFYQGREVCLCWKLGEPRIRFWHGTEEGFRGRKPIDDDFVQHHSADP